MNVLDRFRPKARTFTNAERAALVDELLAERFTPPTPTLTEGHELFAAAVAERDRLQHAGRVAAEEIGRLTAAESKRVAAKPTMAKRISVDFDRLRAPHEIRRGEIEAALADLNAVCDWPALEDGERRYRAAIEELLPAHDEVRRQVAGEAVRRAESMLADARAEVVAASELLGFGEIREALRRAADIEADLIVARRWLASIPEAPKRGRR